MEAPSGSDADLISFLTSSLLESDLDKALRLLASREKSLKAEMECNFFDELSLKEVEKIEAKHQCDVLKRKAHALKARCSDLEDKIESGVQFGRNVEQLMKRCDLLESAMDELQKEVLEWKKKHEEVVLCVSELMEENSRFRSLLEQNHKSVEAKSIPGVVVSTNIDINKGIKGNMDSLSTSTPKRKSGLKIVCSDSEDENGLVRISTGMLIKRRRSENIECGIEGSEYIGVPISSVCRDKQGDGDRVKRLLFPSRECKTEAQETNAISSREPPLRDDSPSRNIKRTFIIPEAVKRRVVISDSDDVDDTGEEDFGSESEGASLGGFIVSGSDSSQGKFTSSSGTDEYSACDEDESTTAEDLHDVLTKLNGKRDENKWEYEADMLASFAKDPKLCMEAVCALYRMQTTEEKSVKGTILLNNRGFNSCDAHRGSMMAEFLIDGDPQCQLRKSIARNLLSATPSSCSTFTRTMRIPSSLHLSSHIRRTCCNFNFL